MNNSRTFLILGGLVILVLLLIPLFRTNQDNTQTLPIPTNQEPQGGGGSQGTTQATISAILDNASRYEDVSVAVNGEVTETFTPRIFMLGAMGGNGIDEIVVVSRNVIPPTGGRTSENPLRTGDNLQINGVVRRLTLDEVESELNIDIDPRIESYFNGERVAIIADNITFINPPQ